MERECEMLENTSIQLSSWDPDDYVQGLVLSDTTIILYTLMLSVENPDNVVVSFCGS